MRKEEDDKLKRNARGEKGFAGTKDTFSGLLSDLKNLATGIAAAPAHIATNPADTAAKATTIGLSAIPVVGSVVTVAYVFKQSMAETGNTFRSAAKAVVAGVAALAPGVGPAITGAYAVKNIGTQVKRETDAQNAAKQKGETLVTRIDVLDQKYGKAKENVKSLGKLETWKQGVKNGLESAKEVMKHPITAIKSEMNYQKKEDVLVGQKKQESAVTVKFTGAKEQQQNSQGAQVAATQRRNSLTTNQPSPATGTTTTISAAKAAKKAQQTTGR
jgi:hypothetical protein